MGFRPAVEVAQAITLMLVDFKLPEGVRSSSYIDNVRFVGPSKKSVEEAGRTFTDRCQQVGAIIGSSSKATQTDDFLGERYDYKKATRKITTKTIDKLKYARELILKSAPLSFRQLAAIFGLVFYASSVLDLKLSPFYSSLSFYRAQMSQVTTWEDQSLPMPPKERQQTINWIASLLNNKPVPTVKESPSEPELTLYVDASEYGWGCVSIGKSSTRTYAGTWSKEDRDYNKVESSVTSEPLGAYRAIRCTVSTSMKAVRVYTDHTGLVYAGKRGYGKAYTYNHLLQKLSEEYRNTIFLFEYIKGSHNPADAYSRGKQ